MAELRKSRRVLVPLVKEFLESEDRRHFPGEDEFVRDLLAKTMERNKSRGSVFSPSALGSKCLRVPYLSRNSHLVKKKVPPTPKQHWIFATGNFIHLGLAVLFFNIEKWVDDPSVFKTHGFEVSIFSKRKDFGGTIDMICEVEKEPFIVDFKGLNSNSALQVSKGRVSPQYKSQVSAYGILWNSQRPKPFEVKEGIIFVQDKAAEGFPFVEAVLPLSKKVALTRLRKLREYEEANQVPPPACRSIKDRQFQTCPFQLYCWDDVKAVEKAYTQRMRSLQAASEKEPTTAERVQNVLRQKAKASRRGKFL